MAERKGKRRRSLHVAFGQEAPRPAAEAESAAEPPEADGRAEQTPTPESGTSRRPASGGAPRQGGRSRARKARKIPDTAKDAGKGKAATITGQGEAEMVPGKIRQRRWKRQSCGSARHNAGGKSRMIYLP